MACSKPALTAQFPVQCQLCENEPKIEFKCLDCDLLMCSSCRNKIHQKFKSAKEHRIIDIKDVGQPISVRDPELKLSIQKEYKSNIHILLIAPSLDDALWIGEEFKEKKLFRFPSSRGLQKVRLEGDKLKIVSSFNIRVWEIAVTPNNDLLVVTEGPTLKLIKEHSNKLRDSIYKVKEGFQPYCVHVTRDNQVIVCAFNIDDNRRFVLVMDSDGHYSTVYDKDKDDKPIFNFPVVCVASTSKGNIFVGEISPEEDEDYGRVVILRGGTVVNVYTPDEPMIPSAVATTPSDNVIITFAFHDILHILNDSGHLISTYNTNEIGIENPFTIATSMAGQFNILYIGCVKSKDSDKANLYKLSYTGF